jgi:hypothetical protein
VNGGSPQHAAVSQSIGPVDVVTGEFNGSTDFGGGPLSADFNGDAFIAKLDAATGAYQWATSYGDGAHQAGYDIAVDGSGQVIATGKFGGSITFGGGPLLVSGTQTSVYLAKMDAAGNHVWSSQLGTTTNSPYPVNPLALALDGAGNVYLAGGFSGSTDFGGAVLASAGGTDAFVASYAGTSGAHRYSHSFGGPGSDYCLGVASDAAGNVYVAGTFTSSTIDLGGGPFTAQDDDIFVASYGGLLGTHRWSRSFGGVFQDSGRGIAVNQTTGNVALLGGSSSASIDFGGGPLNGSQVANAEDVLVAVFTQ